MPGRRAVPVAITVTVTAMRWPRWRTMLMGGVVDRWAVARIPIYIAARTVTAVADSPEPTIATVARGIAVLGSRGAVVITPRAAPHIVIGSAAGESCKQADGKEQSHFHSSYPLMGVQAASCPGIESPLNPQGAE